MEVMVKDIEHNLLKKIEENPLDYISLNKIGYIYLHSNNLVKSEDNYLKSISIFPNQFEPYVSLGLIYTITMNLSKSLYFLLKAKLFNPESKELIKSIDEINLAIKNKYSSLSQEDINELFNEALELSEKKLFHNSIEKLLILYILMPENDLLIDKLASTLIKNGEYELSVLILEEIINKYNTPIANYYIGVSYNFLNKPNKALLYINKSIELKPSLLNPLLNGKVQIKKEYDEEKLDECPNCKSKNIEVCKVFNQSFSSINYNIINPIRLWDICNNCELIFANPKPSKSSLNNYSIEDFLNNKNSYNLEKIIIENNAYNERLNNINKFKENGKLLDIFFNSGIFTSLATDFYDIYTIEKNDFKVEFMKSLYSKVHIKNNIDNIKEKFDIVTLWENIEKIDNLEEYISSISKILKKNGIFAISFNNRDNFISKLISNNDLIWLLPDFIYIYNKKYLLKLFEKYNLKLLNTQNIYRKYMSNTELYFIKE